MTDNHAQSPSEAMQVPPEEIRLAVVLNGGVSLAVWMGGATLELNRVRQGAGVYGSLLRLAGCSARIDVIAGTSAGGINGAALALAQANSKARLQELRDVWTDQGQIDTLLRKPFRGNPTSLLQGDEYFLPRLNEAMARLTTPYAATDPESSPIDLTITTTLLRGAQKVTVDSSGQRLPQWVHDGRFHFVRGAHDEADPFSSARIGETADRLGLAARCTASFPVAFEPTFVPVDRGPLAAGTAAEDRLRPDMAEAASWAVQNRDEPGWINPPPGTHVDVSRFAVDGGLLANMPTRPALRAIDSMPADGPVRRVLVLVHPHAPSELRESADDPRDEPSLAGSLGSLLAALTAQGSRTFVEQIEQHNLTAAGRRGTRADVMRTLDGSARLSTLAGTVFEQYRLLRMWRHGRDTASYVEARQDWNAERVRRNARLAQEHWFEERKKAGGPRPFLPYVPISLKAPAASGWGWGTSAAVGVADAAADVLRRLIWVLPMGESYRTVQESRHRVALLRKQLQASRRHNEEVWRTNPVLRDLEPTQTLFALRLAKYEWSMLGAPNAAALRALRGELRALIDAVASHESGLVPGEAASARRAEQVRAALTEALIGEGPGAAANSAGAAGSAVSALVGEVVTALQPSLRVLNQVCAEHGPNVDAELTAWGRIFGPQVGDIDLLNKLLALEVATTTLGDELATEYTLPLELVQLSAQTPNGFAAASRTADDKLGGMALSRFGGFLKRSWRLNDWTWGRIDAATVLCRMLLEPSRLRRAAELSGHPIGGAAGQAASSRVLGQLISDWFGPLGSQDDGPPIPDWQGLCADAAAELALVYSDRATGDLPPSLPRLAELAAWAIHMRVIAEELPALGRAVRADALAGANPRSNGELLVVEHGDLIRRLGEQAARHTDASPLEFTEMSAADAVAGLRAFDRAGVGRESLRDEGTSDQMLRTATSAAAVAATVVDSDRSGLAAAKPVTRSLRGGLLLPYWVVTGLTTGGALSRALSLLGLSIGAVLLTLALFGALPAWASGAGAAIGASSLLLAFAYGALRTGTLLHSLVLLSPVIPLLAFAVERSRDAGADAGSKQGAATLLFVVALSLGLMIIGSLPAPMLSVWGELDRIADRADIPRVPGDVKGSSLAAAQSRRRVRAVLATLRRPLGTVFVVAIGAAAIFLALNSGIWEDVAEGVVEHRALALGAVLLLAWLGLYTAYKQGGSLRIAYDASGSLASDTPVWRWHPVRHPAGVVVGWAALYGVGYLLLSGLLLWDPWDWLATWWGRALLATCLIFAVALLLLVPVVLPWRTKLRIERAQTEYVYQQLRLGRAPNPVDLRGLALTRRGKRLAARIGDSIEHLGHEDKQEDRMRLLRDLVERGQAYRFLVRTSVFTAAQWTPTEWGAQSLTTTFTAPSADSSAGRPRG